MLQQPASTRRKIRYEVRVTKLGVVYDPTADTVTFALVAAGDPAPTAPLAVPGAWETWGAGSSVRYYAACLVGPGGSVTPTPGEYTVWLAVADSPELLCEPVGQLTIT